MSSIIASYSIFHPCDALALGVDESLPPIIVSSGMGRYSAIKIHSSGGFIRLYERYTPLEVFRAAARGEGGRCIGKFEFDGHKTSTRAQSMNLFHRKGTTCVSCGVVGNFFRKERPIKSDLPKEEHPWVLALYADAIIQYLHPESSSKLVRRIEVRLTIDHIIPLARGGGDNLDNMQPMCIICNAKKDNDIQ